jgi:hypothetical protein
MTAPDPKTVREIAQDALVVAVRRGATEAVESALIAHGGGGPVVGEKFNVYTNAVAAEYDRRAAALARPDEQQPADVVSAEQQQDGAVGRVEAIRARYDTRGFRALSDGQIDELFGFLLGQLADLPAVTARAESAEGAWSAQQDIIEAERRRAEQAQAERADLAAQVAELESERDDDLCILAAFLLPNRRPIEEWLCILANHFEARTNALMRDADRFAAARFRVDRVPNAAETEES